MKSCIYKGELYHHRYLPRANRFTYAVFFMYLDLDELEHVFENYWLWSVGSANVANFKRADYLGPAEIPLDEAVRNRVEQELGERPVGTIRLLTHLRYFGHCFNPVSFYYCFDVTDTYVEYIVAEITNTPWRERHAYVLSAKQSMEKGSRKRFSFSKNFHVSPFMDMDFRYEWSFEDPSESLRIHMVNFKKEAKFFEAMLTMQRQEISSDALAWVLMRFPAMTIKVLAMIYWQAFRLWLKKTPYYEHPKYLLKRKS